MSGKGYYLVHPASVGKCEQLLSPKKVLHMKGIASLCIPVEGYTTYSCTYIKFLMCIHVSLSLSMMDLVGDIANIMCGLWLTFRMLC